MTKWQNWQNDKIGKSRSKVEELGIFFGQKLHMKKMRFFAKLQNCKTLFEWSTKVRIKKTHNLT